MLPRRIRKEIQRLGRLGVSVSPEHASRNVRKKQRRLNKHRNEEYDNETD